MRLSQIHNSPVFRKLPCAASLPVIVLSVAALFIAPSAAFSYSMYSGTSVSSDGTVRAWGVTDASYPNMWHTAYVRSTLQSPHGRRVNSGTLSNDRSVRDDISLPYDASDLGLYLMSSSSDGYCHEVLTYLFRNVGSGSSITVPYVLFSLRTSSIVSPDNAGASGYAFYNGTTSLGVFYFNGGQAGPDFAGWRTGVEMAGTVFPSSYTGSIQFERTYELIEYNDFQQILHYNAGTVDPIDGNQDHLVTDHDPQSGGSHGTVYDLDAPWLGTGNYPSGTVLRKRANLIEDAYIYIGLNKLQVSGKFNWFTRLSVYKSGNGTDVLEQTYPTDNMVGTGLTKLSYNLQ